MPKTGRLLSLTSRKRDSVFLNHSKWEMAKVNRLKFSETSKSMSPKNNIFNNTSFHTPVHFLVLAWAIDRCANILPGEKKNCSPQRAPAQLEKGNSSHLLIKHVLQRFATQFHRPNEFEDDWNKHWNFGSSLAEFWLISVSFVVLSFTDANSTGLLLTKIISAIQSQLKTSRVTVLVVHL